MTPVAGERFAGLACTSSACKVIEAEPDEVVLVAAHGWDVVGAMRAGLRGARIARSECWLVPIVPAPDVTGEDLEDVAKKVLARLVRR